MIVVIAKHGYNCYFVIVIKSGAVSSEVYQFLGSSLCLKVRINWISQQARFAVRYSLTTSMQSTKRVRSCKYILVVITAPGLRTLQVHFILIG